ncbi:hypothetical protein [Microbulbifer pacificus]|uniref:Lipoprotein n=1 Tax=Microbulbifer pacificus TaxID=407164 RepID=A0AAU0MWK5_9GAMM|nr:hypothetical protein [Microbulbifer pacificus]WOX04411.1 hypothetical protein R5R33_11735 [Microbulbifer pacificus]
MFKKIAATAFLSTLFTGCVSVKHVPLTAESSQALQGKTVVATQFETPDFTAFTAGKATLGLIGAAAMVSAGNEIVRENEVQDPALSISAGLMERLAASRAMELKENNGTVAANDKIATLVSEYPGADYILDVKTTGWMFNYYPADWTHYKVTYNARMRLIDSVNQSVISETLCSSVQGDDNAPPTKDDLLNEDAKLLKEYLAKASNACVEVLSKEVLML